MLNKSRVFTGLMVLLLTLFLTGTAMVEAKTIVIGSGAEAPGLDPRVEMDIPAFERINLINESLIVYDLDMELTPRLAEDWEHSSDGLTLTFYLREGVLFHHGREFTAQDVKYTYDWVLHEDNGSPNRGLYTDIVEVEVVDDYTVAFHLDAPNGFLINNMARMPIVPYDKAQEMGDDFRSNPIGTGPYAFDSWTRDDRLTLKAFDDYWGGTPKVETIVFRPIPEDSARLLAFEAGEIHMFQGGVVPEEVKRLETDPNYNVYRTPGTGYTYLGFNMMNRYLNDYRIRQAISYTINREGIVDHVWEGIGEPGITNIPPNLPWFHDGIVGYDYNLEKARELMAEAGYPDGGFSLRVFTNENPVRIQIVEILEYELSQIGIDVEVNIEEWGAFLDRVFGGDDYEMYVLGWSGQLDPDRASYRQFHSEGEYNDVYFRNVRLDELVERGRIVPADTQESIDIYQEVQEILHREQPYAYINYTEEVGVVHPYISGWEMHPYPAETWSNAHLFDIEQ